jgi:ferredoxin-type protein NapH
MKLRYLRYLVLTTVFIIVSLGLALNTSLGTLSSFGWEAIASICPLGALESMLAAKSVFLRALIVLVVMVVITVLFGKVFCSWICPAHPVTRLFDRLFAKLRHPFSREGAAAQPAQAVADEPVEPAIRAADDSGIDAPIAALDGQKPGSACGSAQACTTCAEKRSKLDSRHVVLAGSLLSAAIFGFPVFCLICPIGLIFGTIIIIWQWVGFEQVSLSLLIYPAVLLVELVVIRKWCAKFCPLGALLSLLSLPNRFLLPKVDSSKCLRMKGVSCQVCSDVCPEGIDPHCSEGMNECSKCAICMDECPSKAITILLLKRKGTIDSIKERL